MQTTTTGIDIYHELGLLLKSRSPLIFLDSQEEARATNLIVMSARRLGVPSWEWSLSRGLVPSGGDVSQSQGKPYSAERCLIEILNAKNPGIFILHGFSGLLTENNLVRLLCDISKTESTVVIIGSGLSVPQELKVHASLFSLPLPDTDTIKHHLNTMLVQLRERHAFTHTLDELENFRLIDALRGLTLPEIDQVMSRIILDDGQLSSADIDKALKIKSRMLTDNSVIELVVPELGLEWVAGLAGFKQWAQLRSRAFTPEAKNFGLPAPKGILLTGVPGCGKSFTVKALAHTWGMPLLHLDAGALFNSYVGQSEANLRSALKTAEAVAPSILWVDEIEKGFGSQSSNEADGGVASRLLGTLITWMQERKYPVFLAATSNNTEKLPAELMRQGRFDEIFFVDLPDAGARKYLFQAVLSLRGRAYERFDTDLLAEKTSGYSGAEIEQAVNNALYAAFADGADLTDAYVIAEIAATKPLSVTSGRQIESIRAWGLANARPA